MRVIFGFIDRFGASATGHDNKTAQPQDKQLLYRRLVVVWYQFGPEE